MEGVILLDKPAGWTSFDVVNYVRKIVAQIEDKKPKNVKVGHTGTLDPFATGLLVLLIGKNYTKKASEFSKQDKTYEVTMHLGEVSSTGDSEGEIMPVSTALAPSKAEIEKEVKGFVGEIKQIPPAYSAVKINGQRAYKLARAGKEFDLEPRNVTVNRLIITSYTYPEVKFLTDVSSGTYIRALVEDIGEALGTGAYTSDLRRTKIGKLSVKDALNPKDISAENLADKISAL
jgi:tRNA pseudouridine55 synthase